MRVFKGYVKNQNCPMLYCRRSDKFFSEFLPGLGAIGVPSATEDNKPLGGSDFTKVDHVFLNQTHLCVLHNTNVVQSYGV